MPMYEFECQECGKVIEIILNHSDKPPKKCDCGKKGKLVKLLSAPAFQFKGSGWYVTDYGKGTKGKDSKSESESKAADSSGDSSSSSSGDTKKETKKESKKDSKKESKKD